MRCDSRTVKSSIVNNKSSHSLEKHRLSLLPLLCLELSSVDEEGEFELEEKLSEETEALNRLLKERAAADPDDTDRKCEKKRRSRRYFSGIFQQQSDRNRHASISC